MTYLPQLDVGLSLGELFLLVAVPPWEGGSFGKLFTVSHKDSNLIQ